ncbi:dephospho-CoA kinase [Aromatoleum diolicum]|uniref:Dephospho-CoA kinase n=1 Tax=Aromatoleum diolicum TaxID=75796 RepID=A0ABX1Q6F2_9RHOO|nr:dephospho-CoA kinase [Aromatoleum diolicum]NMG73573.1 dephospho-CoA kinase [Aromatoleum diolicum]
MTTRPYVVGLTGGIGSGKSAAADRFAALGIAVVDTDAIAHALTAPGGPAIAAIRQSFGDDVITSDGALDRKAMRDRAFADPTIRRQLEAILHPAIRAESERLIGEARTPYVVLVVPLLVESGKYRERCQSLCVVDCPTDVQIARVMSRSGLDEAQVRAIMATQASREQRLAAADEVIDNSGERNVLVSQVDRLHHKYLDAARQPA